MCVTDSKEPQSLSALDTCYEWFRYYQTRDFRTTRAQDEAA